VLDYFKMEARLHTPRKGGDEASGAQILRYAEAQSRQGLGLTRLEQPAGLHREMGKDARSPGEPECELHLFPLLKDLRRAVSEAGSSA
jgi:hypothetical protein